MMTPQDTRLVVKLADTKCLFKFTQKEIESSLILSIVAFLAAR
jgi:hypothetical protein